MSSSTIQLTHSISDFDHQSFLDITTGTFSCKYKPIGSVHIHGRFVNTLYPNIQNFHSSIFWHHYTFRVNLHIKPIENFHTDIKLQWNGVWIGEMILDEFKRTRWYVNDAISIFISITNFKGNIILR